METLLFGFCQLGVVKHLMKEYKCRLLNHHASRHKPKDIYPKIKFRLDWSISIALQKFFFSFLIHFGTHSCRCTEAAIALPAIKPFIRHNAHG